MKPFRCRERQQNPLRNTAGRTNGSIRFLLRSRGLYPKTHGSLAASSDAARRRARSPPGEYSSCYFSSWGISSEAQDLLSAACMPANLNIPLGHCQAARLVRFPSLIMHSDLQGMRPALPVRVGQIRLAWIIGVTGSEAVDSDAAAVTCHGPYVPRIVTQGPVT